MAGLTVAGLVWFFLLRPRGTYIPALPQNVPALQDMPEDVWKDAFRMVFPVV